MVSLSTKGHGPSSTSVLHPSFSSHCLRRTNERTRLIGSRMCITIPFSFAYPALSSTSSRVLAVHAFLTSRPTGKDTTTVELNTLLKPMERLFPFDHPILVSTVPNERFKARFRAASRSLSPISHTSHHSSPLNANREAQHSHVCPHPQALHGGRRGQGGRCGTEEALNTKAWRSPVR